jgi:hypothetical protein
LFATRRRNLWTNESIAGKTWIAMFGRCCRAQNR